MGKKASTFVAEIDESSGVKLKKYLVEQDFAFTTPPHTVFSAQKPGLSCTLYTSGKLVVQGTKKEEFIEFFLEPEILQTFHAPAPFTPHIGIDESGKGDLFGPLCIAGVFADNQTIEKLLELGVKDSKTMTDGAIIKMAKLIRQACVHHSVRINPEKYNELYEKFRNLNHLLAWGHATTIEELIKKTGCEEVTIDQFASEHVVLNALKRKNLSPNLTQRHRGEEDPVVAAASILARDLFLQGLKHMEEAFGLPFQKGASSKTVDAANAFIRKHGKEKLPLVCKMHFKTVQTLG